MFQSKICCAGKNHVDRLAYSFLLIKSKFMVLVQDSQYCPSKSSSKISSKVWKMNISVTVETYCFWKKLRWWWSWMLFIFYRTKFHWRPFITSSKSHNRDTLVFYYGSTPSVSKCSLYCDFYINIWHTSLKSGEVKVTICIYVQTKALIVKFYFTIVTDIFTFLILPSAFTRAILGNLNHNHKLWFTK